MVSMKYKNNNGVDKLEQAFAELQTVPQRDPHKAWRGRAAYLSEVQRLLKDQPSQITVSRNPFKRLNGWKYTFPILTQRKERSPMFTVISTLMVIAALVFGGAGATVYAAQESLPDQFLYPIKTMSEEMQLGLSTNPENQMQLALNFADRRVQEMVALQMKGQVPPEEVVTRLQLQLNMALQLAAGMEDEPMKQALIQIRTRIQGMEQVTNQWGDESGQAGVILAKMREVLRVQNRLCELGLQEPAQLRMMFKNENRQRRNSPVVPPTDSPMMNSQQNGTGSGVNADSSVGTGECNDCAPVQDGTGPGPGPGPNAGSGNGIGPGECTDCDPVQDGTGSGPGPNAGFGNGIGPGECTDCNPVQDGTGSGPGPNNGSGSSMGTSPNNGSGPGGKP
jgi:hypothetical protein